MLQTAKPSTLANRGAQPSAPGLDYISLEELFKVFIGFLQRQYGIIVLAFLVMMALTITYLFTTPLSFTSLAKLMIDSRKVQLFQQQTVLGDPRPDPDLATSQV